ncbi:MAG: hypothetical protein IAG10_34420 [Planctomycetaceae bacterium]|nr:hypothetical protein [Planctomycetaceae bacterium]
MTFKTLSHSWRYVWLSCLLAALLPMSSVMFSILPDEVRCEKSEPADASEEIEVGEVTLSESNSGQRRSRREQSGVRRALLVSQSVCSIQPNRCAQRPSAGQASLWGRCGPLHC